MPTRLRPNSPIPPEAVLTGDPGRAMLLAQHLTDGPKMSNHARGLWGYVGWAQSGRQLLVQATGIGGPSAAVVLSELADLGLKKFVRVGSCVGLGGETGGGGPPLGGLVVVSSAITENGVPGLVEAGSAVAPDASLTAALKGIASGVVVSSDLRYEPGGMELRVSPASVGGRPIAADMQTATVLALAGRLEIAAAAILIVTRDAEGVTIGDEELEASSIGAGSLAAMALDAIADQA